MSASLIGRLLVGPKECEITGIAETPDGKTLFINIQHPGDTTAPNFATGAFGSHWPGGGATRPRSATIAITRDDGGDGVSEGAEVSTQCPRGTRKAASISAMCRTCDLIDDQGFAIVAC
jgi:hypothetical protein